MASNSNLYLTSHDLDRLEQLVDQAPRNDSVMALEEELGEAVVVDAGELPQDVVTMNSRARFVDEASGKEEEVTIVYPSEADSSAGRVSVLAPVGSALLGLSPGESTDWPMPNGQHRRFRVIEVLGREVGTRAAR